MKKNILLPILALLMVIILVGCKKEAEVVEPTPTPPVEEPVEEASEDEKEIIMNDFDSLVGKDSKPEEIISYIDDNIKKLSQLEGDIMIDALEKKLEANTEELMNKIFATDADDEMMALAASEKYFPENKISQIKNDQLKKELTLAHDNMYRFINVEGEFYPIVDYSKLKAYDNNISDEWKTYLSIRAMDSDNMPFADGGLTISFADLADRILKTENFLNTYIGGPRQDELLGLYESKLTAYLKGVPNTPIADYSDKKIFDDVLKSYEATSNNEGYITAHMTYQYIEAIKANKLVIDNKTLAKADEFITEAVRMLKEYK